MPEVTLRKLQTEQELDTCARIMSTTPPWTTLGRSYDACRETIGDPSKEVYLASVDGGRDIAGFVVINMQGAFTGYIQSVAVAPERRGQGIGTALLAYAEKRILRDSPNVFMCVSSFSTQARRLYERLGYRAVGDLQDYIVAGHSEILLRKSTGPLNDFKREEPRQ